MTEIKRRLAFSAAMRMDEDWRCYSATALLLETARISVIAVEFRMMNE
jgi:hypothetical protein